MSNGTANNMLPGNSEKLHVECFAQDNSHPTSQIVDGTVPIVVTSTNTAIITAAVDGVDPRAINVHAVAPGTAFVIVDQNPSVPTANRSQIQVTVTTPPDNRRVDFVSADPPA